MDPFLCSMHAFSCFGTVVGDPGLGRITCLHYSLGVTLLEAVVAKSVIMVKEALK